MEPTEKRPNSPKLRVALFVVCLLLAVAPSLYAQRVFKTRELNQSDPEVLFFRWDSVRRARILGGQDYDFAFLFTPGIEGNDYGYAYHHKSHKLVLRECKAPLPLWKVRYNLDGFPMKDKNGCLFFEPIGKVKMQQFTLRLPDSIGSALSEMYRLAILTARIDTTVSDVPPVLDAPIREFFDVSHYSFSCGYHCNCSDDTIRNVQHFYTIHKTVEKAVREHNIRFIVDKMPTIRTVIADWRKLSDMPSEPIPFSEKISEVKFFGHPVPVEELHIKERRDDFEIVCDISYEKWKTRCTIPAWLVDEAKTIDIGIVPDEQNRTPLVGLTYFHSVEWSSLKVGECIQCPEGVAGKINIYFIR